MNAKQIAQVSIDPPAQFRGVFRSDTLARSLYAEGAGIARTMPAAVAVPADSADVATLLAWAKREGHGVIPRGSGSGMAAGAVGQGIMLDVSRFTEIGPVDAANRRIRVGCGALRGDVDAKARDAGLRFPVDPSSGPFCTIGGMVGTNAAGARSLRFGATRAWVTGLRCLFDDGTDAWIRRDEKAPGELPAVKRLLAALDALVVNADAASLWHVGVRKESSGYALQAALDIRQPAGSRLVDLLVGSEGTLAVFTEVELALTPLAEATATLLATFATLEAATDCAGLAREAGATACELLDRTFLDVAATGGPTGVASDADAVLLVELEGIDSSAAADQARALAGLFRTQGASDVTTAVDTQEEHRLWELRHAASPILSQLGPGLRSMQFIEDGCVPPANFPTYIRGVREALARGKTAGVIFGHAGDAHAHVNPLVDVSSPGWRNRMRGILEDVCALTARCGGTLAGEHGDGRLRASLLKHVWSTEARAAFANIKDAGDPSGVLNPGCKIARGSEDPLASLRHDPAAAAIDPRARAVLDQIERERDWARFRLEGLPDVRHAE